jgi:hypothetical protein
MLRRLIINEICFCLRLQTLCFSHLDRVQSLGSDT